jgi:hypothetical protein
MFAELRPVVAALTVAALVVASTGVEAAEPAAAPAGSMHAGSPIAAALDRFDFGDYEGAITLLRPIVEHGAGELPLQVDRIEALRVYGIACTLTDRKVAAEGAFLLLLREEPSTQLDPRLVRPEAVAFFEEVRARHRDELLSVYRRGRPRYYWYLNFLPTVGQFQNRQRTKAFVFGATELTLLAGTIVTWSLLNRYEGSDHTFAGHQAIYDDLRPLNIACFTALLTVTAAGIVDGFVVGTRRDRGEREAEARLGF